MRQKDPCGKTRVEAPVAAGDPLIATIAGEPFMLARSVLQVPSHSFGGRRQSQRANTERLPPVFFRLCRNDTVGCECVVSHRAFPFGAKVKVAIGRAQEGTGGAGLLSDLRPPPGIDAGARRLLAEFSF
jgi:hypothetical protein